MLKTTRRQFIASGIIAAGAFAVASPAVHGAEKNKKYKTALVGTGWWGKNILGAAIATGTIEPVALVDVDKKMIDSGAKLLEEKGAAKVPTFTDYREMLEKIKPEIVINATPDHWHPLITIAACQAGAHVYVEKPISHTINEGIAMVKTARETKRTVQVGTHRRVSPHNIQAMEYLRSGKLGKIGSVRALVHYPLWGGRGTKTPDQPTPEGLDWDMWCGPAPLVPFNPRIHPKGFRGFLNFANGQLGDWGIHWMDQILWWSQEQQYPKSVSAIGGRFLLEDNTDVPDTLNVQFQFDGFNVTWEHRYYAGNAPEHHNVGVYYYGEKGTLHLGWIEGACVYENKDTEGKVVERFPAKLHEPDQQNIPELWTDFIESIETGRTPVCDIEKGHRSTSMALLGMLALKVGRGIRWDGEKQLVVEDAEANSLLKREYRSPWKYPE